MTVFLKKKQHKRCCKTYVSRYCQLTQFKFKLLTRFYFYSQERIRLFIVLKYRST